MKVAFQGERGAYSEDAAVRFFADRPIEPFPCVSFERVFAAVEGGECEYGVIAIENSLAGSIYGNYDLLLRHDLPIVGEQYLKVVHCLITLPGVGFGDIKHVYAHPQALAQCEQTLDWLPHAERHATYDNAGSVALIKAKGLRDAAALASARAAEVYEMEILKAGVADNPENYTRFLVLGREPVEAKGEAKTSIVFSNRRNVAGALFKALSVFALRDIDLVKIQSRPQKGQAWQYLFYLDFMGNAAEPPGSNALNHLQEITSFLKVLGTYPRGEMDAG